MEEVLALAIFLPATVIAFFAVLFGLARVLSLDGIRRIFNGLADWRFNLWHIMVTMIVAALVFHLLLGEPDGAKLLSAVLLALLVLAWFVRAWCREFVFVMGLRDDDFPGRNDKLLWAVVLLVMAPIGVWLFRSYRLVHWPEPKPVYPAHEALHPETPRRTATQPV
jgi:hypothetical protein